MDKDPFTVDVAREFHRRMATIIDAVQTGIWEEGVHALLGYATDYAFGEKTGPTNASLEGQSQVRLRAPAMGNRHGRHRC